MSTGNRIRTAREAKQLTQDELGSLCGTTKQTIFKYENGIITNIPIDRIEKIAFVLDVSPAYLTGWEEENESSPGILPLPSGEAAPDPKEARLTDLYRQLNTDGQEKLIDYADDLVSSGKYIKSDPSGLGQKQA